MGINIIFLYTLCSDQRRRVLRWIESISRRHEHLATEWGQGSRPLVPALAAVAATGAPPRGHGWLQLQSTQTTYARVIVIGPRSQPGMGHCFYNHNDILLFFWLSHERCSAQILHTLRSNTSFSLPPISCMSSFTASKYLLFRLPRFLSHGSCISGTFLPT